jgi:hypothetical protein
MATPGTAKRQQSELLASTASSGRPRREASKGVERLLDRLHGGHEAAFDVPGGPEATARSMSEVTHNGQAARPRGRAKAQSRSRRSNSAAQDFADLEGAPDDAGEAGPADEPGESDLVTNLRIQLRPELQRLQDIAGAVNTTPNSVVKAAKEGVMWSTGSHIEAFSLDAARPMLH